MTGDDVAAICTEQKVSVDEFLQYRERFPDFFPQGTPLERQVGVFKVIQQRRRTDEGERRNAFARLDNAVECKGAKKNDPPVEEKKKDTIGSSVKKKKEIPEYTLQPRGWFEREGKMYIEVIDDSEEIPAYFYATLGKTGEVSFIEDITVKEPIIDDDEVIVSGLKYVPRQLPMDKDGQPVMLVGIPTKAELEKVESSDASAIKGEIYTHILRYCDLPPNDVDLCVYYIFMTWFFGKLTVLPYLRFRSDTGKGKSRILKTVSDLCFLPVKAGGSSTSSGIVRMQQIWRGTLVIDEADISGSSDTEGYANDMIKFLNLGFEAGQYFIKSDKIDPSKQEVFDPFSPKVIAMRGIFPDPATEGRCLSISPSETERKDIPPILPDSYQGEVQKIRAALAHFMLTHWGCITESDPYPSFNDVDCEGRLKQLGSPLARVLSKIFPDGLAEFKHYIERRQVEVKQDRAASFFGSIVNAAFDRALDGPEVVTVREIADATGQTSQKISRVLKDVGMNVEPRKTHITVTLPNQPPTTRSITQKIAVVKDARSWREICRRYIAVKCEQTQIGNTNDLVACPQALRSKEFVLN